MQTTITLSTAATTTTTTTMTITSPASTPTAFNLYYFKPSYDGDTITHYAVPTAAPGGSGTILSFAPFPVTAPLTAAVFSLDSTNNLADQIGGEFGTNAIDKYGYLFYQLAPGQDPIAASACDGILSGSSVPWGNQFADCEGYLAMGGDSGFRGSVGSCNPITLEIAPVVAS